MSGFARLSTFEGEFEMTLTFGDRGCFEVNGRYREMFQSATELIFVMAADQTYILPTLEELQKIYDKYGDNFGKKSS